MAIKFQYKSASALLDWHGDEAWLLNVWAHVQKQGHGTGLMEEIVRYADKNGIDIWLIARPFGRPYELMTPAQCEEFYTRFGFVRDPEGPRSRRMSRPASRKIRTL